MLHRQRHPDMIVNSKQRRWTYLDDNERHFVHSAELQPTRSWQTPQRSTFETLLFFPNNNCIPFVLSTFTRRPLSSTAFFHLPYLAITSFNDSPHGTRSSAYKNFINEPSLTSSVRTFITMINKIALKADLWWTPAFTENELDSSPSTEAAVLQSV